MSPLLCRSSLAAHPSSSHDAALAGFVLEMGRFGLVRFGSVRSGSAGSTRFWPVLGLGSAIFGAPNPQFGSAPALAEPEPRTWVRASFQEFKVAQERRFHALQREPGELARFKAAQVDGLKDQHSYMPAALSPPLKSRSVSLDTHMQEHHTEPNPHSLNLSSAGTTSSLRDSTASILSQQAQATSVDLMQMQMQIQQAGLEIAQARDDVLGLEEQRDDADRQASHAKKVARQLRAENLALVAREKRKEGRV
ncbi:hypothetical protein C8F01DRAFT_1301947 [Mycena amicta]|nr:hypothetical protein C8F01DRAFT_1301947 [Mycena amicta]